MSRISLYRRLLPFGVRYFMESLFKGKFYYKAIPIKRNKQGEITYELSFRMTPPSKLGFGIYCNLKDFRLWIYFLWFEFTIQPFEDLPF